MSARERMEVVRGDITQFRGDAIVNASNPTLLPGLGVCGAIHRAAGHRMAFECAKLGGCKPGQAKSTPGFRLYAPLVIHTVGPTWRGGQDGEAEILAECYANCLQVAVTKGARKVAFPAISTGIFSYPLEAATSIALRTVKAILERDNGAFEKIAFYCYSDSTMEVYEREFDSLFSAAV